MYLKQVHKWFLARPARTHNAAVIKTWQVMDRNDGEGNRSEVHLLRRTRSNT